MADSKAVNQICKHLLSDVTVARDLLGWAQGGGEDGSGWTGDEDGVGGVVERRGWRVNEFQQVDGIVRENQAASN